MCDNEKFPERPGNANGNLVDVPKSFLGLAVTPAQGLPFVATQYHPSVKNTPLMHISEASRDVSNWLWRVKGEP